MSAYVVSTDTIDVLVAAADRWRVTFMNENQASMHACTYRDEAGQLLLDENVRSVNCRYEQEDAAEKYRYNSIDLDRAAVGMPVAVLILQSVRCLRYQSCESPDYYDTRAARFLDSIEKAAINILTGTYDAPWGFTRDWMNEKINASKAKIAAQFEARR